MWTILGSYEIELDSKCGESSEYASIINAVWMFELKNINKNNILSAVAVFVQKGGGYLLCSIRMFLKTVVIVFVQDA